MSTLPARPLSRRQAQGRPPADVADPVLRRVLAQRGVTTGAVPGLSDLLHWQDLKGIEAAAELLAAALEAGRRILVVGDFDADGATGTALAVSVLRRLGGRDVNYLVPDRRRYGYGLSAPLAELALRDYAPELVLTVDNGISSLDGVQRLRAAGVAVLVTDHHLPGEELPVADVIVNPNQPGDSFASKNLAGVGVVFYLLLALRHRLGASLPLADELDLVALGTVADLVPLDVNNRILVREGLKRMRAGHLRPGLAALIDVAGRDPAGLDAAALGFVLGPRINAAGRLEHMDRGIECLLAPDATRARPLAEALDAINRQRRERQAEMQDAAVEAVLTGLRPTAAAGLCLHRPDWHEGIVGLVASRLKERFHRPAVAFAPAADGLLKGSGRSVPGFHLRDALALIDARRPGLIRRFGGHAMAAGLSLAPEALKEFAAAFEAVCEAGLSPAMRSPQWLSDGPLSAAELTPATVRALADGGPWGQGFEPPLFDNRFAVRGQRIVGNGHLKLQLALEGTGATLDAIAFGVSEPLAESEAHLVYELDLNDYYSPPRLQLLVRGAVG